jgi:hypothetical protein
LKLLTEVDVESPDQEFGSLALKVTLHYRKTETAVKDGLLF